MIRRTLLVQGVQGVQGSRGTARESMRYADGVTRIPRVIAGRWAITTTRPLPFDHESIERGFRSARPTIRTCLEFRKLPPMTVRVRLVWQHGTVRATVLEDNRELGPCAAAALQAAAWPAFESGTLDVIVTTREWDDNDDDD